MRLGNVGLGMEKEAEEGGEQRGIRKKKKEVKWGGGAGNVLVSESA